ncbi:MAG: sulfide/dihydroorotate dehydrogenase-like FAD/NAD-binding protein [Promethearchaeota archaeon]
MVSNEELVPNVHRMVVKAPHVAAKARAGQFALLMSHERGEKVPLTLADWDAKGGTVTFNYLEVGLSTRKLARMRTGQALFSLVGPLGHPTDPGPFGRVLVGGGCYGVGAAFPLARVFKEAGNEVVAVVEARSQFLLYGLEELRSQADCLELATCDGSVGHRGRVHDVVASLLASGECFDRACFVGCTSMMANCSRVTFGRVPTRVWLNSIMLDGTGMCGCCRVRVGGETKFACVDGPEFDGHLVDWDELRTRTSSYAQAENLAYQFHSFHSWAEGDT